MFMLMNNVCVQIFNFIRASMLWKTVQNGVQIGEVPKST